MQSIIDAITQQISLVLGGYIPSLAGALAILIIGWLVALVASALLRAALRRTGLDNRLARWATGDDAAKGMEVERWFGRVIFWVIMLFVLVAFFDALNLTRITEPLNRLLAELSEYAPRLLGAAFLLLVAWIVASALRVVVSRVLKALKVDERLGGQAGLEEGRVPLSRSLADVVYWLVFLLFLPAVLGALALEGILGPVQGMIDNLLGFLPNLLAAGLILVVGWFAARIVQRIVTNLLAAIGADEFGETVGLARALGRRRLSGVIGLIVYALILIPVLIAALNALALEAVTRPASNMLDTILGALPAILAASLLVIVAYVVGRVVAGLVSNVLTGVGFNRVLVWLGLGTETTAAGRTPAEVVGYLVLVAILFFAAMEASRLLGFVLLADLVARFLVFVGHVVLGLIIFAIGLYLANLAATTIRASGTAQAGLVALAARVSILLVAGAVALRQMGLANEIINLAFGLLLGSVALAAALAFGLGGREVAARELQDWLTSLRSKRS